MTERKIQKAIADMELVADWLDSDNPTLRQIADQTFDILFIPTVKAHLQFLLDEFPEFPRSRAAQDMIAMLVLSGDAYVSSTRAWFEDILRAEQPYAAGAEMPQ